MNSISKRYIYATNRGSWVVRIPGHYSRSFSYKKDNGKNEALKIARQWRDRECDKLEKIIDSHSPAFGRYNADAKGYCLVSAKKTGRACWRASFNRNGKKITKSFSINRYGFDGARNRAKQQRIFWITGILVPIKDIMKHS
ncbi:MAG: AP2/ERF family transcription factor [Sedimenticola sp.]